jgi:hypothetical protein
MATVISAMTLPARLWTDDLAKYATFDARAWFATASTEDILGLASSAWSGDAANEAARYAGTTNSAVADVLQYAMFLRHGGLKCRATCSIDPVAALEWLAYHRPDALAALRSRHLVAA